MPAPRAQHRIFDEDGFIARVDFAYPDLKIAIEYDGLWTAEPGPSPRTVSGSTGCATRAGGFFFVTAADMHDPEAL